VHAARRNINDLAVDCDPGMNADDRHAGKKDEALNLCEPPFLQVTIAHDEGVCVVRDFLRDQRLVQVRPSVPQNVLASGIDS